MCLSDVSGMHRAGVCTATVTGKVCKKLVDLGEAGAAIKGGDVIGGEGDGSGIGSWEGHVDVLTEVEVTL